MQILFITHYFAPDSGAAANRLTNLAHALKERGHEVTVLTTMPHYPQGVIPPEYRGRFVKLEEQEGIKLIQVWLWTTQSPKILWRLVSQISFMVSCILYGSFVKDPDVIFIENQPIFTGFAGWFISKVKRRNYVLNVSDYWPEYLVIAGIVKETSLIYRVFRALTNLTQRDATAIVALLDDLLVKIEARIGKVNHSYVIQNVVDLVKFHPAIDGTAFRQQYAPNAKTLVTFLGGLGPHIDLETMLETARYFKGQNDIQFLFVGTGSQKENLDRALADSEFAHCKAIEWLDFSMMPEFWAASDINFWALHHNELDKMRFQAKLYEALASGTPTVIAVEGLMSEILGKAEAGITVSQGDSLALAKAIEHLCNDDAYYQKISQNARSYAEANFEMTRYIEKYETALEVARGI